MNAQLSSPWIGACRDELPTPCLVADLPAMERNLSSLQSLLDRKGKALRAHVKTHKSSQIALRQIEKGAIGICAAKLSEAEKLVHRGIQSVLITGPVVTNEAHERLQRCLVESPDLMVVLDDLENARSLSEKLMRKNQSLRCLIDLDPQFHRTGVPMDRAIGFAKSLSALPGFEIVGIQAYAGNLQHLISVAERRERSTEAMRTAAAIFRECREMGFTMDIFSGGGTGTLMSDLDIPEMTEIQAGSYLFMDEEYAILEWDAPRFETALFLLSTVVSANHREFVTIDAGLKAMYRDGGVPSVVSPQVSGAGYEWFGDEYGKVFTGNSPEFFPLGQKIQLSLSHVDPTINLFDQIFAIENEHVVQVFPIDLRGCCQ